uniref:Tesmin/TSO1-like CXC domain-containing protein n=1 Tax=Lygus hesperus TaxID=30085 RepID=A0A0A9Y436_LYGHE
MWRDREMNEEQWGWKSGPDGLMPVQTTQPPAPEALLNSISCACKTGCKNACSCRKVGINCSAICAHCKGHACLNSVSEQRKLTTDSSELDSASEDEDDLETGEGSEVEEEEEQQELGNEEEQPGPSKIRRTH